MMKRLTTVVAVAALATVSMTASAWWGGPAGQHNCYDGKAETNAAAGMGSSMNSRVAGRGHGFGRDYHGYPFGAQPYGVMPPVAMTEAQQQQFAEQQKLFAERQQEQQKFFAERQQQFAEQQKAFAEQQAKAYEQMMANRDQQAQQFAPIPEQMPVPFAADPMAFDRPFGMGTEERDARREEVRKMMDERQKAFAAQRPSSINVAERDARFEQMRSQMEERRKQFATRMPAEYAAAPRDVRHDDVVRQMEERRAEMMKRVEDQHAAMRRDFDQRRAAPRHRDI